ncbi:MAG TPA: prephenate dehydrogenase/arogenate dehydrogenase family protein [Gammaproteobacteria bacterium]|nr:prephenate dehydrogenase/arogenate dehydrogenase family protein [Gammaproteobacteria bacterium]
MSPGGCLAVIGPGLIGGSAALAARAAGLFAHFVAYTPDRAEGRLALERGIADRLADSAAEAAAGADFILLAVPPAAMGDTLAAVAPMVGPKALITDVGSVKAPIVEAARAALGERFADFVPGHPLAGAERHGAGSARADLFRDHRVLLTPLAETDPARTARVAGFWTALGAAVEFLEPLRHDEVLALTSHLPHLLAFSLVDHLLSELGEQDAFRYAAGGFRDFTRIAASDADLWADIGCANRVALLAALSSYRERLGELAEALARADRAALAERFQRASAARRSVLSTRTAEGQA